MCAGLFLNSRHRMAEWQAPWADTAMFARTRPHRIDARASEAGFVGMIVSGMELVGCVLDAVDILRTKKAGK